MARQAERAALIARKNGDRKTLFWSERGEVSCAIHAPYPGTDTWWWGRWKLLTEAEAQEWSRALGRSPRCEVCK
jgi:hypothetical protein